MVRSVTVEVPATSANLGPGFDSLGIALSITGRVTLALHDTAPADAPGTAATLILAAAGELYTRAGLEPPPGLQAGYEGDMPVGRGLGASAVLRAGAVVAANRLLDGRFDDDALLQVASELEGHADNVAPALFGGFQVVVWSDGRATHVKVPFPSNLKAVVLVPEFEMPTAASRRLLPERLTRSEAVHNIGRAALMVAALATSQIDALRVACQDVLHQPARARIFPALPDVIAAALHEGAACAYLSGAGSAVVALTTEDVTRIGEAMLAAVRRHEVKAHVVVADIHDRGSEILRDELLRP